MAPTPTRLRADGAATPLGIDVAPPRFGWTLSGTARQASYRLLVGTDPDALADGEADVWDSGRVDSGRSVAVSYDGPPLESRTRYHWTVRVEDDGGRSGWADPAWFETGLATDDWRADWIAGPATGDDPTPAPALRREFELDGEVERARVHVTAGGFYELRCNGTVVGDRALDPGLTDYEERVRYATHDVTGLLEAGSNAVGAVLGRGRYALTTPNVWGWHEAAWQADRPALLCQLEVEYADGRRTTIASDGSWRATASPTRFDSIYEGEVYDAREALGAWTAPVYDAANWDDAAVVDGPDGDVVAVTEQPIRAVRELAPVEITEPESGVFVARFDEMIAGWAELAVEGDRGDEITLRYGERLRDDGTVDAEQGHVEADIQRDVYVCAGGDERWAPRFSYKGFQYVEVRGYPGELFPDDVAAVVVHTTIEDGSHSGFESDDDLLNRIHANTRRALLNNHHSIPTDTPTYEKNGWTGDAQLTAETALYDFRMARFYRKWFADFADAQRDDGELPPIVPTSDWGYSDAPKDGGITSPNPAWDAAYVLMAWWCYEHTGDERFIADHLEGMARYVRYLRDRSRDHVVDDGLGDWLPPSHEDEPRSRAPEGPALTSTAYYYRMAEAVAGAAATLGRSALREEFADLAGAIADAFHDRFYDADAGHYRTGEAAEYRQTSNVLPLAFGLVPDEHVEGAVEGLVADVADVHDEHLNTGILGTKYLLPVLSEHGHVDLAYEVATRRDYPSWGHWIEADGATALYEAWELSSRSLDHHMYGSIGAWLYGDLAGVRPVEPGFETVAVEPRFPAGLDGAAADVDTVRGVVSSAWERDDDDLTLAVTVPGNTDARVRLRDRGEVAVTAAPGGRTVRDESIEGDDWTGTVGPGEWTFEAGG